MTLTFGLDYGHGRGRDRGAKGILNEEDCIEEVGKYLYPKLLDLGHTVVLTRPDMAGSTKDSLIRRCKTANDANVDLFVSIHFNAFNFKAEGTEVLAISQLEFAGIMSKAISKAIGTVDRGAKLRDDIFVLKHTKMPAILIESLFIDNKKDCAKFKPELIAHVIANTLNTYESFRLN